MLPACLYRCEHFNLHKRDPISATLKHDKFHLLYFSSPWEDTTRVPENVKRGTQEVGIFDGANGNVYWLWMSTRRPVMIAGTCIGYSGVFTLFLCSSHSSTCMHISRGG